MAPRAVILLLVAALAAPSAAVAAEKSKGGGGGKDPCGGRNEVIAKVGSTSIRCYDLIEEYATLPRELQEKKGAAAIPYVRQQLVGKVLLEQAARKAKFTDEADVKRHVQLIERETIASLWADRLVRKEITKEKVDAAYKEYAAARTGEEVCVHHIVVNSESEAKAIIADLDKGSDFATIARDKSIEPSGKGAGGELGCFTKAEMPLAELADAALAGKKGDLLQTPVKTRIGWHVVRIDDRRTAKPEPIEKVEQGIAGQLAREYVNSKIRGYLKDTKIVEYNLDGSPLADNEGPAPTRGPARQAAKGGGQGPARGNSADAAPAEPQEPIPQLAPQTAPDQLGNKK